MTRRQLSIAAILANTILSCQRPAPERAGATAPAATTRPQQPASAPAHTYLAVLPSQLVGDYKRNEVAADARYRGRIVEVTGQVARIRKDFTDRIWVELHTPRAFSTVDCSFDEQWTPVVAELVTGQLIALRARVQGYALSSVRLGDSALLWVGAPPAEPRGTPTPRAQQEADVLAASLEACVSEIFDREIDEIAAATVEKVLRSMVAGTPTREQRDAAEKAARESAEKHRASETYRQIMARAEVEKTAGARELVRLQAPALRCDHPALRLAWACKKTQHATEREEECNSEEMQLVTARYSALLKQLPPESKRSP